MIRYCLSVMQKFLFWRRINSTDKSIDNKTVERYFDSTQSIIFTDAYARKEEAFLLPLLSMYRPKSVLDLGCGNGRYAKVLSSQVQEYVGVDLSSNFIRTLSEQNKSDNLSFVHSAAHAFKAQRSFDMILMIGLLTYMNDEDIREMLNNSLFHLKKDGILVVRNVHHAGVERRFFNDRFNFLKRLINKPTYQIIRRPETEFMDMFSQFDLISRKVVPDTAGVIYMFKHKVKTN